MPCKNETEDGVTIKISLFSLTFLNMCTVQRLWWLENKILAPKLTSRVSTKSNSKKNWFQFKFFYLFPFKFIQSK